VSRLIVVRHGETQWNVERRIQGSSDIPLNDTGLAQVAAAGAVLAGEVHGPVTVVASPLQRAFETARPLGAALGVEVQTDDRLVERSYGVWEGLTPDQRRAAHPAQHEAWSRGHEPALEGYETHDQVATRVRAAADEWLTRAEGDLIFVTHGSSGRMLILSLLGLPQDSPLVGYLGNATWSVLAPHHRGWSLIEHNARARG